MTRIARIVIPEVPHHITHRGNNGQAIFVVEEDRFIYADLIKRLSRTNGLEIIGYCLMPNHIHIIGIPEHKDSLKNVIGKAHFGYSRKFNTIHERTGHLWENRFYSCPMDDSHTRLALRYVDRNPVRSGLVIKPSDYVWSSARGHLGNPDILNLMNYRLWENYKDDSIFEDRDDEQTIDQLRKLTRSGRPFGLKEWCDQIKNGDRHES